MRLEVNMQAILFCGGMSTRMGGGDIPKPMVEIGGQPVVWHIMKHMNHYGIKEFFLALGHSQDYFKDYFIKRLTIDKDVRITKDGNVEYSTEKNKDNFSINLIDTGESTLTGGRLRRIIPLLNQTDPFFMAAYGDVLSDINIKELIKNAKKQDKIACLTSHRAQSRFGIVTPSEDGTMVESIKEKPIGHDLINIGYFVFKYDIIKYLPDATMNKSIEEYTLGDLAKEKQLANHEHMGFYQPMDTVKEFNILKGLWDKGEAPWKVW